MLKQGVSPKNCEELVSDKNIDMVAGSLNFFMHEHIQCLNFAF